MTQLFIDLVKKFSKKYNLTIKTPNNPEERGSQVAIHYENGFSVIQALIKRKIIADYRDPGIMRFGFSPLYLSFTDIWDTVQALADILKTEEWGLRILAHEIKNNQKGFYFHIKFEGVGKTIDELEKAENIDEMLLRFLTVRVKKHDLDTKFFEKKER